MKRQIPLGFVSLAFIALTGCELIPTGDGSPETTDQCPSDPAKTQPGVCGCGVPEGTCSETVNQIPAVRFVQPTQAEEVGKNLSVLVEASDPDGSITFVDLYINHALVRRVDQAPYEWGTANSQLDEALCDLVAGSYELQATAFDNDGAEKSAFLTVQVTEDDGIEDSGIIESDKKVAAFYYGWYSTPTDYSQTNPFLVVDDTKWRHWGIGDLNANNDEANSRWTPTQGWFDSADPSIIETHLTQAEWAGIDAFVASFWGFGKHEFEKFKTMLRVAKRIGSKMKFTLYIETARYKGQQNAVVLQQFKTELESIYDYFTNQNQNPEKKFIWTHKGKPVLFTYVQRHINEEVWTKTVNYLANRGKSFFLVVDRPDSAASLNKNFQGAHQYDVYAPTYRNKYLETFGALKTHCKKFNQVFCAGIAPGYDDTYVRPEANHPPLHRKNGETYRKSWQNAMSLNPDWITITSWNEWHEGSEIEPSVENGDLALTQTRKFIQTFKNK